MRRRFVIGVAGLDDEQNKQFRKYIAAKGAWWHWIDNFWLMTTKNEMVTAEEIRDKIGQIKPDVRAVVFEFPADVTWATYGGKNAQGKNMSDWLVSPWGDDG